MNIQIFGLKKSFDSQKAERYFKERKINYQYIELERYGLSKGEFASVKSAVGLKELINVKCKEYNMLNMSMLGTGSAAEEMLFKNPRLYNGPIVRNGSKATVGYKPEIWAEWE